MIATINRSSGFKHKFSDKLEVLALTVVSGKIPKDATVKYGDGEALIYDGESVVERLIGTDDIDLLFFEKKPSFSVKDGNGHFTIEAK